jgi:phosphate transport system substrate-binding protein
MKKAIVLALVGFLMPASASSETTTLEILGTGDGLEILRAIASHYSTLDSGLRVKIPPSIGSGGGIAAVGSGRAVLGRVARELTDVERAEGLIYVPIAHLPSAFFAHPSAYVQSITAAQLVDIYNGRISNWKDVGGADLRIRVIRREDIDSTLTVLRQSMPGWKNLNITDRSKMATSTQEAIQAAHDVPGAIGFAPYSRSLESGLSVLKIDNLHPLDERYPSSNQLALIYMERSMTHQAIDFVKFCLSEQARRIISEYGGVPASRSR